MKKILPGVKFDYMKSNEYKGEVYLIRFLGNTPIKHYKNTLEDEVIVNLLVSKYWIEEL